MDSNNAPSPAQPAIRTFRICVGRPVRYPTILAVVRLAASDPTLVERSSRRQQLPRPVSIFA